MTSAYNCHLEQMFQTLKFEESVNNLIENIISAKQHFKSPLKEEIEPLLIAEYVREVWLSESPPQDKDVNTIEIVDHLVEHNTTMPTNIDVKTWNKLKNVHHSICFVMAEPLCINDVLTETFVKQTHAMLATNGVINDGGKYRTKQVRASGSSVMYCRPGFIAERLSTLLSFLKQKHDEAPPTQNAFRISYMLRLGTIFFSEFLLIHPFSNGNGRTARILLNAFLKYELVVPFSLYVRSREMYIDALEARNDMSPPIKLALYLLMACNKTSAQIRWLSM